MAHLLLKTFEAVKMDAFKTAVIAIPSSMYHFLLKYSLIPICFQYIQKFVKEKAFS